MVIKHVGAEKLTAASFIRKAIKLKRVHPHFVAFITLKLKGYCSKDRSVVVGRCDIIRLGRSGFVLLTYIQPLFYGILKKVSKLVGIRMILHRRQIPTPHHS